MFMSNNNGQYTAHTAQEPSQQTVLYVPYSGPPLLAHGHPDIAFSAESTPPMKTPQNVASQTSERQLEIKQKSGWKPFTLRRWFLVLMVILMAGLFATVETLREISARHGGLSFARSNDTLSTTAKFLSSTGLTVFSVVFSLIWSMLDLDVKRMEVFFQLGKPEGAKESESLRLDYSSEFLPLVPVTSFRKR
jgi:hypothetical protein